LGRALETHDESGGDRSAKVNGFASAKCQQLMARFDPPRQVSTGLGRSFMTNVRQQSVAGNARVRIGEVLAQIRLAIAIPPRRPAAACFKRA
jgi:hypothetical protein